MKPTTLVFVAVLFAASAAAQVVGKVTRWTSTAYMIRDNQAIEIASPVLILAGDELGTGPNGRIRLQLENGSTLSLGIDTRLTVSGNSLKLEYGMVRGQFARKPVYEINTKEGITRVLEGGDYLFEKAGAACLSVTPGGKSTEIVNDTGKALLIPDQRVKICSTGAPVPFPTSPKPWPGRWPAIRSRRPLLPDRQSRDLLA